MNIVSVEASSNICSVSSFKNNELINLIETNEDKAHSRNLPIMIKRIIQDFSSKDRIHAFSISIGPGSFTSLRISLSLVKGISTILKNKIIPVSTFEYLNFQINAGLNDKIIEINRTRLIDLGSNGLAKRIDILTNAGLIE